MRPGTTDPPTPDQGWASELDALDPAVLPESVNAQLEAWRSTAEELTAWAKENAEMSDEAIRDWFQDVLEAIDAVEATLDRWHQAPIGGKHDVEEDLARLMTDVQAKLEVGRDTIQTEVRSAG